MKSSSVRKNVCKKAVQKLSGWRDFFIVLGVLQLVGIGLILQAAGQGGMALLAVYILFFPPLFAIAVVNLVGLSIYLSKNKPRRRGKVVGILSLLTSLGIFLSGMYYVYVNFVEVPMKENEAERQAAEERRQFAADNANPEITKAEAIKLLKACKLKGLYYTDQTDKSDPAQGGWGELASTGIVLTKVDGYPYRISIADRHIPELVPIARDVQKTCDDLQLWHDGGFEDYENGKRYFNGKAID